MAVKNNDMIQRMEKIGQGGFGEVYLGSYGDYKEVAIKDVKGRISDEALAEAKILKKLTHQRIIRYIDIVRERHQLSIIMEFIDGGSLWDYIGRTAQSSSYWRTTRDILIDVAYGMSYLHDQNIVHADLKSLNVLLRQNYSAVICDFGLARVIVDTQTVATCHPSGKIKREQMIDVSLSLFLGTERWFAPELCSTNPERSSFPSDVWAYGCVILEIISKNIPWFDMYRTNGPLLNALAKPENATIFETICVNQRAPEKLRAILCRCCTWRKNQRSRFLDIIKDLTTISDVDLQNINQGTETAVVAASSTAHKKRSSGKASASLPTPKADSDTMNGLTDCMSELHVDKRKSSAKPRTDGAKAQSNNDESTKFDPVHQRQLFKGPRGGWYYFGPSGNKIYTKTDSV